MAWRLTAAAAGATLVAGLALAFTGLPTFLCEAVEMPALFRLRQAVGLAPELDPRLKIFAYDDETLAKLGRPSALGLTKWAEILTSLKVAAPRTLIVDAIFASPMKPGDDVAGIQAAFGDGVTKVVTGMAVAAKGGVTAVVPRRNPALASAADANLFAANHAGVFRDLQAFGPSLELVGAGGYFGDLSFREPAWVRPVAVVASPEVVEHVSLFAADSVSFNDGQLFVNDTEVPLSAAAETVVDWPSVPAMKARAYSLWDAIQLLKQGNSSFLGKGDVVLVLPLMYTGSGDEKLTSVGRIAGGYVQVAMANSVLRGSWLATHASPAYNAFSSLVAACFVALTLLGRRTKTGLAALLGVNAAAFALAMAAFCFGQTIIAVACPALLFSVAALAGLMFKAAMKEVQSVRLAASLRGIVPPRLLQKILSSPTGFVVAPVEEVVTAMFIDIVGFSVAAEAEAPRLVFDRLKSDMALLITTIHKYGGIVDKTLGDGLLGFFGYDPFSGESTLDHADVALACAVEIQRAIATRVVAAHAANGPALPVRIGLNTGPALIGDLGHQGKVEITIIGHTVNMAKRYEDACEPFKVIIGPKTRDFLQDDATKALLTLRYASIKHHAGLIETFECDPFLEDRSLHNSALEAYRKSAGLQRGADRHLVDGPPWEVWHEGRCIGEVIDVSATGLRVYLDRLYAAKVTLRIDLRLRPGAPPARGGNADQGFTGLYAHVKWGYAANQRYCHGLRFSDETIDRVDFEALAAWRPAAS